MEKSNTKNDILEAALELFSVQGYEATSLSQIAEAVGIRKASVYSHFESKQKILDALTSEILEQYDKYSIFSQANLSAPEFQKRIGGISPDEISEMILKYIRYILHDPHISKSRKMLTVEQFRNPELQKLQTKQNYTNVTDYFTRLIKLLIKSGRLIEKDPEIAAAQLALPKPLDTQMMAAQFAFPISVWMSLCDREPERESEVTKLIERHVRQFFEIYAKGSPEI